MTAMGNLAPRVGVEAEIHNLWQQVLGRSDFGVDEDFFDVGGTSLLALRLVAEARRQFGFELSPAAVFERPTVGGLSLLLRGPATNQPTALVSLRSEGRLAPLYCVHPSGGSVACYLPLARALAQVRPVFGLQALGLSGGGTELDTVEAIASAYLDEIVAARGRHRFGLVGYSFGGVIALELARQWQARFAAAPALALIDTPTTYSDLDPDVYPYVTVARHVLRYQLDPDSVVGLPRSAALSELHRQAIAAGRSPSADDLSLAGLIADVVATNTRAAQSYVYKRSDTPAILFRGTDEAEGDADLGWRPYLPNLRTISVDADHYAIVEPAGVAAVVPYLNLGKREGTWSDSSEPTVCEGSRTTR